MKKIPGVVSAKVSLNQGLVTIQFNAGNTVRLEQIRKAVTDQGFTPKGAKVTAFGDLVEANGRLEFKVRRTTDVLRVRDAAQWRKRAGANVLVTGAIPAAANRNEPREIDIRQVSK